MLRSKKSKCKMQMWVSLSREYLQHRGEHNHAADPIAVAKRKVIEKAKRSIRADPVTNSAKKARIEALTGEHEAVVGVMKPKSLDRALHREKKKLFAAPKGKTSPRHLQIPPDLQQLNAQPFIFYDSGQGKNRAIGMSTPFMLEVLCVAEEIADDGTFLIIKPEKGWSQLFTLHAKVSSRYVPAVMFFLSRATTDMFKEVLKSIDDWCIANLRRPWRPKSILTDNEGAQRATVREYFEAHMNSVEHKTCWFHYVQAIMRKLKELGLLDAYFTLVPFFIFVRKLCCLALIDPDSIGASFDFLRQQALVELQEEEFAQKIVPYLNYFESTWIRGRNGRYARIPCRFWNHHDAVLAGDALTTNSLESWHHKTTEAANKFPKKSIWYLLHHAKNELGEVSKQRVIHLNQGVGVSEQTRAVQQKKIQLIQEAVRKFDIQKLGDSLARMANSIDGINVEELSIEDA